MNFKKHFFSLIIAGILVFSLQNNVYAQFQGHTAKGGWGLQSGSQIPEGFLIAPVYINYSSSKLMNKDGEEVRNITGAERDLSVNGAALLAWWVSKYKIFGANYGIMALLPFQGNSIGFASKEFKTKFGMGDFYLQPVNLGWHFKQLDVVASYGIYFPTGRYDADASDNTGMGMWTHELGAGATVFFDENKNWHLSSLAYFEMHSKKKDIDINVGNILTLQGGLGRSFFDGGINVGVAYYMQWKLSADKIGLNTDIEILPDEIILENKHSVYALGPDVTVPIVIKEKLIALVTARYQWEFGAKNNLQGNMFNLFLQFPLFSEDN
jgi:hypothetical protein